MHGYAQICSWVALHAGIWSLRRCVLQLLASLRMCAHTVWCTDMQTLLIQMPCFCWCNNAVFGVSCFFKSSNGSVQPTEVFPGACSRLPAAHSPAGSGAGMAAAGYLPAVSASLDVGWESCYFVPRQCYSPLHTACIIIVISFIFFILLRQASHLLWNTWAQWLEVSTPSTCFLSFIWSGWCF